MTKEQLVEALNGDLAEEFASAIQYVNHAALITGARYMAVQEELLTHATEEMQHATVLASHIASLGGRPTTHVANIVTSDGPDEMLRQDLMGEKDAVARYKERIRAALELGEYGLARVLQDIIVMEEEHVKDLEMALGVDRAGVVCEICSAGALEPRHV
jgi:bacterioferritin